MTELPRVLTTGRLSLRPWRLDDVDAVMRYASLPEWAEFLPVPQPYTRAHAEEFVAGQRLCSWKGTGAWALCVRDHAAPRLVADDVPEGGVDLARDTDHRASLGFALAPARWGRGYIVEAARAVIDAGFRCWPDLQRIYAFADARNTRSRRVLEKLGLREEGVLRGHHCHRGVLVNTVHFGLLRDEWT
jgi:RimJ/RimL family protein N-acetyltransferase